MMKEFRIRIEELPNFSFEQLSEAVDEYNKSLEDKENRGAAVANDSLRREVVIMYKTEQDIFMLGAFFGLARFIARHW